METTCIVGTDIATFFLYEPDALRHRATSPWCWFADWTDTGDDRSGLTVPELSDGRLVMINTAVPIYVGEPERLTWIGSDGAYVFRCTTGGLTPDERDREYPETHAQAEASLLHVTQGRVLLDGGYLIPYDTTGERVLTPGGRAGQGAGRLAGAAERDVHGHGASSGAVRRRGARR